jgi:hypothetical protein
MNIIASNMLFGVREKKLARQSQNMTTGKQFTLALVELNAPITRIYRL